MFAPCLFLFGYNILNMRRISQIVELSYLFLKLLSYQRFYELTLARLKTRIGFINYKNSTLSTHYTAIFISRFSRFKRVSYFHCSYP